MNMHRAVLADLRAGRQVRLVHSYPQAPGTQALTLLMAYSGTYGTAAYVDGGIHFYGCGPGAVSEMPADAERTMRRGGGCTKAYYAEHPDAFSDQCEHYGDDRVMILPTYTGEPYEKAVVRRDDDSDGGVILLPRRIPLGRIGRC